MKVPRPPSASPTLRRKLLALAISLIFSLVAAEVLVRIIVGSPRAERLPILEIRANPDRGWEMVPNAPHYTYLHTVRVNGLGLRGSDLREKSPRESRVLALGDSLIYGQGVADDETVPHFLELKLDETDAMGRSWTVINGGHRAYNTRQELALLEELGPVLEQDIVILFWFWNDLKDVDVKRVFKRLEDKGQVTFDTKESMEGFERLRWHTMQLARRSALLSFVHDFVAIQSANSLDPQLVADGLERLGHQLDRMVSLSERWDFDLVLAIIPDPNSLAGHHESLSVETEVVELARNREIPQVRLVDPLRDHYGRNGQLSTIPYDGHYTPEANRVMADSVAEFLLQRVKTTTDGP